MNRSRRLSEHDKYLEQVNELLKVKIEPVIRSQLTRCCNKLGYSLDELLYQGNAIVVKNKDLFLRSIGMDVLSRAKTRLYTPRPDLAIGPFNFVSGLNLNRIVECILKNDIIKHFIDKLKEMNENNISEYKRELERSGGSELTKIWFIQNYVDESRRHNPRCFIAIEVCFSGSLKDTLGSIVNASILGYYGLVIANERMYDKVLRTQYYLRYITQVKGYNSIGYNVLVIKDEQFIQLLKNLNNQNINNTSSNGNNNNTTSTQ